MITTIAAVCALSSTAVICASAASETNTGTTSLGYRVSSTISYSGNSITGTGRVVSGGTCDIEVFAYGYYVSNGVNVLSCSVSDKQNSTQKLTKSTSGSYTITSAMCISRFNGETNVTARV